MAPLDRAARTGAAAVADKRAKAGSQLARTVRRLSGKACLCDWPEDCGCFGDIKSELEAALEVYRRKTRSTGS